jgi:peptidoglycan hydrolase-like protein with peptidoglycan-binding domain
MSNATTNGTKAQETESAKLDEAIKRAETSGTVVTPVSVTPNLLPVRQETGARQIPVVTAESPNVMARANADGTATYLWRGESGTVYSTVRNNPAKGNRPTVCLEVHDEDTVNAAVDGQLTGVIITGVDFHGIPCTPTSFTPVKVGNGEPDTIRDSVANVVQAFHKKLWKAGATGLVFTPVVRGTAGKTMYTACLPA